MKTMEKTLLASLIVPLAIGVQSASAVQIEEWGYEVDSSLSLIEESGGDGSVTSSDGGNTLSWGTTSPQSSISIEDVSSTDGGLFTDGAAVDGGAFTHNNRVINADDSALTEFGLTSSLTLTPVDPPGDPRDVPSLDFDSFFSETLNMAGTCVDASSGAPCDDIFTIGDISNFAEETDFGFQIAAQSFTIENFSYTVFLELENLENLDDDACTQAGAPDGCVGLLTQENNLNTFNTRFRIASQQVEVPEPGTLALLGLSLAGLGLSRRKARK